MIDEYEQVEVWQPLGHNFAWAADQVVGVRCYEFGPVEDIFRVKFVHVHTGGDELVGDRYSAYAGYAQHYYMLGKDINQRKQQIETNSGPDSFRIDKAVIK